MDVIREDAAAAVAARVAGAYPREVWLAVIQKVFDCGFKTNEQLEGITTEQVVAVEQALSDSGIPVGHLFVRKVISAYIDRQRVPFGPRKAPKGGEGPGSRTLTGDDVRWIIDLLAWNGACGVSLSIFDICHALFGYRGVIVSDSTVQAVLHKLKFSKKRAQARARLKYTPFNMAYYHKYCISMQADVVAMCGQRRLRFLDETGSDHHATGGRSFWGPKGQIVHHTDSGPGGKRYNVIGVTSCNMLQPPLLYCVFEGTLDTALFEQVVVSWLGRGDFFPGDVLVIDNATVHTRGAEFDALRAHFKTRGVSIVPLPVYSPELNPIELIWNMVM